MNTKRNKLEKLFNELEGLYYDSMQYKAFLKSLCDEFKISYKGDEDLEKLLNKLLDKVCSSGCSEIYNEVLKKVNNKIKEKELEFIKSMEELKKYSDAKKNNDQGLTL